ncbi:MAG: hypothetical protein KKA81_06245 [Bacteroidetes bacterium]|nr:hypothetical protein [Bacteroidota bacterium]
MKFMERITKNILFILVLLILCLPALQKATGFISIKPLDGDFVVPGKPEWSWSDWESGIFQDRYDDYLEQNLGLRPLLVRINNQLDYSLFRKANAEGVSIGREGYLYENDYIRAYLGRDFMGDSFISKNIRRMKFLQDHLKAEFNIDLILVLEPSKTRYFPEFLPEEIDTSAKSISNYEAYRDAAKQYGLNLIDLNHYSLQLKNLFPSGEIPQHISRVEDLIPLTKRFPVYTRNGIHWSAFSSVIMGDTIVKYIEKLRNIDMPEMKIDSIVISRRPQSTDNDVSKTMNLLWDPPMKEMAYPQMAFGDTAGKTRPMVLVVGDSYYWNIFNTRLPRNLFANEAFWYFYARVYPDYYQEEIWIKDINIREEIEKQDVILLMVTERFLFKFDWGFINDLYKLYGCTTDYDKIHDRRIDITRDNQWFADVIRKAQLNGLSLEEMITLDALYMMRTYDLSSYLAIEGPAYYEELIKSDQNWLGDIRKKAEERGLSLDEMIHEDARFMLEKEYPEIARRYYFIENAEAEIRADSVEMAKIRQMAIEDNMTEYEMIRCMAEKLWAISHH